MWIARVTARAIIVFANHAMNIGNHMCAMYHVVESAKPAGCSGHQTNRVRTVIRPK